MEIVNNLQWLIIFAKSSILDVWQGSEYDSLYKEENFWFLWKISEKILTQVSILYFYNSRCKIAEQDQTWDILLRSWKEIFLTIGNNGLLSCKMMLQTAHPYESPFFLISSLLAPSCPMSFLLLPGCFNLFPVAPPRSWNYLILSGMNWNNLTQAGTNWKELQRDKTSKN